MTYSVIYSAAAERDIHDIYSHLLDVGSSEIANNVIAQILYTAETLAMLPLRYERSALFGQQRRVIPISSWRIWYSVRGDVVSIDRILHKRRQTYH